MFYLSGGDVLQRASFELQQTFKLSENWYEFDEMAEKTKSDGLAYYMDNNIVPASEAEILKKVKNILE